MLFRSEAIYPPGFQTWVEPGALAQTLEGTFRPGHFRGVATVVLKLLQLAQPTHAYFGRKDFQQLAVVTRMATDLNLPVTGIDLHAPVGLDLGSDAPEAVALAIAAEIQAVLGARGGGMLKHRYAPIHEAAPETGQASPALVQQTEAAICELA